MYLQVQKEKRLKGKALQTVTREETPEETPKEAATMQTVQKISIDYKKILQGLFILSTGIVLIPLYICVTITKNLK